jgi:hypothetical protein
MITGGVTKGTSVVETFYGGVGVGTMKTGGITSTTGDTGAIVIMIAGNCLTGLSRVLDLNRGWPRSYSNCKLANLAEHILLSMAKAQPALFIFQGIDDS